MAETKIWRKLSDIVNERKELRLLTQTELARRIGCSQGYLSELLKGDKRLSDEWIEKLCDELGLTLSDLDKPSAPKTESKGIQECLAKLNYLHENSPTLAFRNVARSIDDWLTILRMLSEVEKPSRAGRTGDRFLVRGKLP